MKIFEKLRLGEPDAHVLMRRARAVLLALLILATLAAALLFVLFRPAAYLAMLALPLLCLAFAFTCYLERQSRAELLRVSNQLVMSQEEVALNIQYAGIYTMMAMLLLFGVATLIMAATMVKDWSMVGLVAVVMFVLSSVMLFPYMPLFIAGSEQDQQDKQDREPTGRYATKNIKSDQSTD